MNKLLIMLMLVFITSISNATKIYTWIDKNGEKHFSQNPPPNQTDQKYSEKTINATKPTHNTSNYSKTKNNKVSSTRDRNVLKRGETGSSKNLIKKKNPDKLFLVYTPNVNKVIYKAEVRKGRSLTASEIKRIRENAKVKAVTAEEMRTYK